MSGPPATVLQAVCGQEVRSTLADYEQRCAALEAELLSARQRLLLAERKSVETATSLREECARERARYRALEAKMDEFQLQTERAAQRRVDDLQAELADLREQATKQDAELRARDAELDSVSVFVTEKVTIDRRLQLAEARVRELEQQLANERERHLAESAERRAALEARHSRELEEAERDAVERTNAAISAETRVLRQQNKDLQHALLLLRNQRSGSRMGEFGFAPLTQSSAQPAGASSAAPSPAPAVPELPALPSARAARAARILEEDPALGHLSQADVERYAGEVDFALQQDLGKAYLTIKRLRAEISSLKATHEQERKETAEFVAGLVSRAKAERQDAAYELKSLEKLVYSKCKELYRIRALAQTILQQRTDLETLLTRAMVADLGLERDPAPYPRTMAEMERSLNEPVRVAAQEAVTALSSEQVAALARRWAAEIGKAGV